MNFLKICDLTSNIQKYLRLEQQWLKSKTNKKEISLKLAATML